LAMSALTSHGQHRFLSPHTYPLQMGPLEEEIERLMRYRLSAIPAVQNAFLDSMGGGVLAGLLS